mgnify:CR=1 FL=1
MLEDVLEELVFEDVAVLFDEELVEEEVPCDEELDDEVFDDELLLEDEDFELPWSLFQSSRILLKSTV